ncbi:protein odr-4 homolog [Neocloeon triangulifer]|uniref:protein odr-4 homolog n=1 Tax=Neocloeon triangulifer TaxID=2078957 RepID=UPI00286F4046|nr:protein odr-4 homolog [Neocloeon triangulifer]
MLKGVHAEESLREYLENLGPDSGFVSGLVLGQRCQQHDYVIHAPPTPNFESKEEDEQPANQVVTSLADLNAYNLQSHAKNVSGLLSGGHNILGIYSISKDPNSSGLLDTSQTKKLETLLAKLNSPLAERLVLHYNCTTHKATCKYMDAKMHLNNVDFKFQSNPIRWEEVDTRFVFDFKIPLPAGGKGVTSTKTNLKALLNEQEKLLRDAHCLIGGAVLDKNATLDTISRSSGDEEESRLVAQFLVRNPIEPEAEVVKTKCAGVLTVGGHVHGRVFLHPKTSIEEVVASLKEDIVRSLRTRVELHTDALIEEEEGSPEEKFIQHDLPRRVLFSLPCSSAKISNYLFPGEASTDSQASLELLLGCQFEDEAAELEEEVEDPELMVPPEERETTPMAVEQNKPSNLALYAAIGGLVLILAIVANVVLSTNK